MKLHTEHIRIDSQPDGQIIIEPDYLDFLRTEGYTIEEINEIHVEESNSRDKAHLVLSVDTYEYPVNNPELDFEAHRTTLWVCSCEDYRYNRSVDVSKDGVKPTEAGVCKHIKECNKVKKAQEDEQQTSLG